MDGREGLIWAIGRWAFQRISVAGVIRMISYMSGKDYRTGGAAKRVFTGVVVRVTTAGLSRHGRQPVPAGEHMEGRMSETDRERLERIKRETAYEAGPADGVYVTRRGKPLEITVRMADLDWLIAVAERVLVSRPDVVRPR